MKHPALLTMFKCMGAIGRATAPPADYRLIARMKAEEGKFVAGGDCSVRILFQNEPCIGRDQEVTVQFLDPSVEPRISFAIAEGTRIVGTVWLKEVSGDFKGGGVSGS